MKYQLVLQWPSSSILDYDTIIEIEELLIEGLSDSHEVDGHDAGSGEINIFIHTNNPSSAFNEVTNILIEREEWVGVRAAYREFSNSDFVILWPKGLKEFAVK